MTYNDWRDELKNNLLNVSEAERRRVLDYYAEAYADRRAAGFSEREIIEGFGAPYDAAQAILEDGYERAEEPPRRSSERPARDRYFEEPVRESRAEPARVEEKKSGGAGTVLLVILLCIVLCGPVFGLIMAAFGITVGLVVAPVSVGITGAIDIVQGIVSMISTLSLSGLEYLGVGFILVGLAVIGVPLCLKLVKLLWKLYKMAFQAVKDLIRGK